jgi:hypothetical protein
MTRSSARIASVLVAASAMTVATQADEHDAPSLSVVWVDVTATAPWAFPGVAHEVAVFLGRMGVRGLVRRGDVHDIVTKPEVTVVFLPRPPANSRVPERAMGATSTSAPSTAVFASEVARTLGLTSPPETWSITQRRDFGVALGRVVVHELVHTVIPDQPHERRGRGLMAACLSRNQLVGPAPPIAPETVEAFRSALRAPRTSLPTMVAALPWLSEVVPESH